MLALYLAFIGFATSGTTLGYSIAIVSARNVEEAATLATISLLAVIPSAVAGMLLLLILIGQSWFGFGDLPAWTSIAVGFSLVLTGFYFTLRYWLIRTEQFRLISNATIAQSLGRVGAQVAFGLALFGWVGLLFGEIIGRGLGLRSLWKRSWSDVAVWATPLRFGCLKAVALDYRKFPMFTVPSAMLNSLALVLPIPLVSNYFGVEAAGQYSIATRLLLLPLVLVGASVGDVFHNRIATYSREQPHRALQFFLKVFSGLILIGLIPMTIMAVYGETLLPKILGEEWSTAGQIAAIITPWALMQFAVNPLSRVVAVYQGQELKLIYDFLGLVSIVGVFVLGSHQGWSLIETCAILSCSQAGVYGVYFLLLLRILKKREMSNYILQS